MLPGGPLDIPEMKKKNVVVPLCGGNIDTPVLGIYHFKGGGGVNTGQMRVEWE